MISPIFLLCLFLKASFQLRRRPKLKLKVEIRISNKRRRASQTSHLSRSNKFTKRKKSRLRHLRKLEDKILSI